MQHWILTSAQEFYANAKDILDKVHKTPEEIDVLIKEDEKGYAYYDIMGLKENITFCLENKLDMALFCY